TLLVFMKGDDGFTNVARYDIPTNTWNPNPLGVTPKQDFSPGSRPILDPVSKFIYWNAFQTMDIYNPSTSVRQMQSMPSYMPTTRLYGGASYVSSRRSLMYVGGMNASIKLDDGASQ
ncbi:hypothetical protein BGX27_003956, partial [Mortierella sp. AM989]